MNIQARIGIMALVVSVGYPAWSSAVAQTPSPEGLVAVRSWNLDQLYVRPGANLAAYRKVLIDPVQVAFRPDWNQSEQDYRGKTRRLLSADVQAISNDIAATLQSSVAEAFRSRGYEVVATAAPDVLRLTPIATDLYVNAGDETPPGQTKLFTKDAGEATLVLEARNSVNGDLLARVVDHRSAPENKGTQLRDLRRTTNVTSTFWFDTMVRRWATACAKEFEAEKSS